jgi:hypothetical protein
MVACEDITVGRNNYAAPRTADGILAEAVRILNLLRRDLHNRIPDEPCDLGYGVGDAAFGLPDTGRDLRQAGQILEQRRVSLFGFVKYEGDGFIHWIPADDGIYRFRCSLRYVCVARHECKRRAAKARNAGKKDGGRHA